MQQFWRPSNLTAQPQAPTATFSSEQRLVVERKLHDVTAVTLRDAFEDLMQLDDFRLLFDALASIVVPKKRGILLELHDDAIRASLIRRALKAQRCAYGDTPLVDVTVVVRHDEPGRVTVRSKPRTGAAPPCYAFELGQPLPLAHPKYLALLPWSVLTI
jgi:hypothetical protein